MHSVGPPPAGHVSKPKPAANSRKPWGAHQVAPPPKASMSVGGGGDGVGGDLKVQIGELEREIEKQDRQIQVLLARRPAARARSAEPGARTRKAGQRARGFSKEV